MAFRKDKTGSAQTAANASAVLVAAFADQFKDFDAAVDAYNEVRTAIFEDLSVIVDADNEVFAAAEGGSNGSSRSSRRSNGKESSGSSKTRSRKSGGGSRGSSSRGSSKVTLDDALSMELSFGAFEGETLETVLGLDTETCDDEYSYGDGERNGEDYISWLASDKNKNEFVQKRARLIADENDIEY